MANAKLINLNICKSECDGFLCSLLLEDNKTVIARIFMNIYSGHVLLVLIQCTFMYLLQLSFVSHQSSCLNSIVSHVLCSCNTITPPPLIFFFSFFSNSSPFGGSNPAGP